MAPAGLSGHPNATACAFPLKGIKVLSFDCYGTLIDWESGILSSLAPLLSRLPAEHECARDPRRAVLALNKAAEGMEAARPSLRYDLLMEESYLELASALGLGAGGGGGEEEEEEEEEEQEEGARREEEEAREFGRGPGKWEAFPDSAEALSKLEGLGLGLVVLSNVDRANVARTAEVLRPASFAALLTAEEIGSYKPDRRNFEYCAKYVKQRLGADYEKGEHVHVARSLTVDHVACKEMGLRSVWISRGGDTKEGQGVGGDYEELAREGKLGFGWRFDTLGDFARVLEEEMGRGEAER
ncbi:hypothetical protein MKZ38_010443 [Zalerion maritima]|uniref:Uncharacterized protein n=1 Tax=Zalerion maritima TaxID=339359 RepID=A0AAD5S0N1_9PEZI|nr:hypothetical protein MKZ38_010443 [Zalerion maritima]